MVTLHLSFWVVVSGHSTVTVYPSVVTPVSRPVQQFSSIRPAKSRHLIALVPGVSSQILEHTMVLRMVSRKAMHSNGTASKRQHVLSCSSKTQVQFCTGKVCRKQGAIQLLKFARDLGLEEIEVGDTGCLGNCGNGPSMVILPEGVMLRHVNTPRDVADILAWQCKVDIPDTFLRATELRLAANMLAMDGDLDEAIAKYTAALALDPPRGKHMIHSNLSAAYLQRNDREAALQHAQAAVELAPAGFHVAYIRKIDALYALGRYKDVAAALHAAVQSDAGFKALPEYKVIKRALAKAGVAAK